MCSIIDHLTLQDCFVMLMAGGWCCCPVLFLVVVVVVVHLLPVTIHSLGTLSHFYCLFVKCYDIRHCCTLPLLYNLRHVFLPSFHFITLHPRLSVLEMCLHLQWAVVAVAVWARKAALISCVSCFDWMPSNNICQFCHTDRCPLVQWAQFLLLYNGRIDFAAVGMLSPKKQTSECERA